MRGGRVWEVRSSKPVEQQHFGNFNQYWPIWCCHVAISDWSTSMPSQLPTHLPYFQLSCAVTSILKHVAFKLVRTADWISTSSSIHDTCRILIGPYCHMSVRTTATSSIHTVRMPCVTLSVVPHHHVCTVWKPCVTLSLVPNHHVCTIWKPCVTLSVVPCGTSFCQICMFHQYNRMW